MKYTHLLLPVLATFTTAQTVLQYGTGELPDCAKNCQAVTEANAACVPPSAPVTSQAIYDNCFCQSNFLANNLAAGSSSSVSTVCNSACTDATDQLAIQNWYDALCNSATTSTTSAVAAATTTTGTATSTTASTATSATTPNTSDGADSTAESSGQLWWHDHARWIAMAIVLVVAFVLIGLIGGWLKKRNTRKHQREAAIAPPVVWGPHQNQHYTGGVAYGGEASREKGKQRAGTSMLPTASQGPVDYSEKDGTKKLKKFFRR